MSFLEQLHNRIDLTHIPFTDRGTRLMLFRKENELFIRLAERWEKVQTRTGHYRMRPPILKEFAFLDDEGVPLPFEVESYPHLTKLKTDRGTFDFVFTDAETLLLRMPAGKHSFQFSAQADRGQIGRRGGDLHGIRNIAYTTNAKLTSNEMSLLPEGWYKVKGTVEVERGNVFLLNITPRLGFNRSIPDAESEIKLAYDRWEKWFSMTPPVLPEYREQYDYAWWIMRAGLLSQRFYFTREALAPSKIHYVGVWQWDQFFHALAFRHVDARLAEDQLRIVLDHQRGDGMLPDAIHDEGTVTHLTLPVEADVTKPPLASWAAL
jgi:putative isomerase